MKKFCNERNARRIPSTKTRCLAGFARQRTHCFSVFLYWWHFTAKPMGTRKHERGRNASTIRLHTTHKNALPCGICKAVHSLLFSLLVLATQKVSEMHKRAAGSFVVAKFRESALRRQQSVCPFVFTSNSAYLAAYHLISSLRQPSFTILAISSASDV